MNYQQILQCHFAGSGFIFVPLTLNFQSVDALYVFKDGKEGVHTYGLQVTAAFRHGAVSVWNFAATFTGIIYLVDKADFHLPTENARSVPVFKGVYARGAGIDEKTKLVACLVTPPNDQVRTLLI